MEEVMQEFVESIKSTFDMLEDAPEINIHNFDISDVETLNDLMVRAYNEVNEALKELEAGGINK
ncbi:MAG: hypothetical protein E3J23_08470 [Candidatus Stahlbacteria bacterium]|nr:MAG: hypothetical protein E3J23_08470 [Candidatus Stahlbacteria bacterium]